MPSDRIRQGNQRRPARPLGFQAAKEPPPPSILVAARGSVKGCDIRLFSEPPAKPISADRPLCGLEVDGLTAEAAQAAQEAGLAFVLFRPSDARADALVDAELDVALNLDDQLPERDDARLLAALRPILVVLPAPALPLSLPDLLNLRQTAALLDAPFALQLPADVSDGDLRALRDAGLAVALLDPARPKAVAALRERIAALPEPRRRRESANLSASVPAPVSDEDFED